MSLFGAPLSGSTLMASTPVDLIRKPKKRKSTLGVESEYETKRHKTVEEGGATAREPDEVRHRAVVRDNAIREYAARIGVDLSEKVDLKLRGRCQALDCGKEVSVACSSSFRS